MLPVEGYNFKWMNSWHLHCIYMILQWSVQGVAVISASQQVAVITASSCDHCITVTCSDSDSDHCISASLQVAVITASLQLTLITATSYKYTVNSLNSLICNLNFDHITESNKAYIQFFSTSRIILTIIEGILRLFNIFGYVTDNK